MAEQGAKVWVLPPSLYLSSILTGVVANAIFALRFAEGSALRVGVGLVVMGAGLALIVSASGLFRRMGQDPNPREPSPELTRAGPYRFTRNPMYLGLTGIQLGPLLL